MKTIFSSLLLVCNLFLYGNNLNISGVSYNSNSLTITFNLSWENSFNNGNVNNPTYDGVWIFIKYAPSGGDQWLHADIASAVAPGGWNMQVPTDGKGVMIWKNSGEYYSNVSQAGFEVTLQPLMGSTPDFKVFGVEMIYVDEGAFYLGDGNSSGSFFIPGTSNSPIYVNSEQAYTYNSNYALINKTLGADYPADFPKGYEAFWCMKYKVTQEQYLDFLICNYMYIVNNVPHFNYSNDTLYLFGQDYPFPESTAPTPFARNSIKREQFPTSAGPPNLFFDLNNNGIPNEADDGLNIVISTRIKHRIFLNYLDWSGLRPMSVFEFEKLCRGEGMLPIQGEFAWGNTGYSSPSFVNGTVGTINETLSHSQPGGFITYNIGYRAGGAANDTTNRVEASATFYGIMDIYNTFELMADADLNTTSLFNKNIHGDGMLEKGEQNVPGWETINFIPLKNRNSGISAEKGLHSNNTYASGFRGIRKM